MTDDSYRHMPDDDADRALDRKMSDLGILMRHKARAEADPPDEAFIQDLEARLILGDGKMSVTDADIPGDPRQDDTSE